MHLVVDVCYEFICSISRVWPKVVQGCDTLIVQVLATPLEVVSMFDIELVVEKGWNGGIPSKVPWSVGVRIKIRRDGVVEDVTRT